MIGISVLFFITLSLGTFASMILVTRSELGSRFFRLNAMIAAILLLAAYLLSRKLTVAPSASTQMLGITVLSVLYAATVLWLPPLVERATLMLLTIWLGYLCHLLLRALNSRSVWPVGDTIVTISGGIIMGLALVAMNIGHSYLSSEKQSIAPLKRITFALGAAIVWRGACLIISVPVLIAFFPNAPAELSRFVHIEEITLMSVGLVRILFGLIGPFFLTIMTWETVKIHSTQSATGILYALLALVLVGEASALFLTLTTALPV